MPSTATKPKAEPKAKASKEAKSRKAPSKPKATAKPKTPREAKPKAAKATKAKREPLPAVELGMPIHEVCSMFPEMGKADFDRLVESIRDIGQQEPIRVFGGSVVDGRSRLRACRVLDIFPNVRDWEGDEKDLRAWAIAENIARRHLTASQLATHAADEKKRLQKEIKRGRPTSDGNSIKVDEITRDSIQESADKFGVSSGYVIQAEQIRDASPETFEAVRRGEKTIPQAKRELGLTVVNGQPGEDKRVSKARANGKIPDGAEVHVEDPGKDATSVKDVVEALDERKAIEDEISDDDWFAKLPIAKKGSEFAKKIAKADAVAYRHFEATLRDIKTVAAEIVRAAKKASKIEGAWCYQLGRFLRLEHPKNWKSCPTTTDGGCGGAGTLGITGQCPKCHGRGYLAN